jgi:hypothetical protein
VPPAAASALAGCASTGPLRAWQNSALAGARLDRQAGTDSAAVAAGCVAVTVVTLLSHAPPVGKHTSAGSASASPSSPWTQPEGIDDNGADAVLDAAVAAAAAAVGADGPVAASLVAAPAEDSAQ